MSREEKQVEEVRRQMVSMSKRMRIVLVGTLACVSIIGIALYVLGTVEQLKAASQSELFAAQAAVFVLLAFLGAGAVVIIMRMLAEASSSSSLFSRIQSRRMFAVGVLLLVCSLAKTAVSVFEAFAGSVPLDLGVMVSKNLSLIHDNILIIVAAVLCFYLSYAFHYGSFLEWLYDETA